MVLEVSHLIFGSPSPIQEDLEEEEIPQTPKRVLIFTSLTLLSLLSLAKYGNIDGTFKSQSRQWKQLFVVLVDFCGASIPILFAFLPDKTEMSYFMVVFFLFFAFNKYRDEIKKLTGKDLISLRKLKSDFEIAIHRAFECFKACIYIYGLDKY